MKNPFNDIKTRYDRREPLFSVNAVDALIIAAFTLFFVGILCNIIGYGS